VLAATWNCTAMSVPASNGAALPFSKTVIAPKRMLTRAGSMATPLRPAAARILPQLGSAPAHAVFTKEDVAIVSATRRASAASRACSMRSRTTCFTPSPSETICSASDWQTSSSAAPNALLPLASRAPEAPLAYMGVHICLPGYVAERLTRAGVGSIADLGLCTYCEETRLFSYRRSQHHGEEDYGRQISAIVLA